MINNIFPLIIASGTGILLGIIFYGGLWWTVRQSINTSHVALLFSASFLLRIAFVLLCFYLITSGDWKRLLFCLGGFYCGRLILFRFTRAEDCHAS